MSATDQIAVQLLDPAASRDHELIARLTRLINGVYARAEDGLWRDEATRTTADELVELVAAGQIAVATTPDGLVVGSVRIRDVPGDAAEFAMLVAAHTHRGTGIGRALVGFVEREGRDRGRRAIQLELLVPRAWRHPSKVFLKSWYGRIGYRIIDTRCVEDAHPHLAPLLATPCDLEVHEKQL